MADDDVLNERFPAPDIIPDEFERWAAQALYVAGAGKDDLTVTLHDTVTAPDGTYDFDATVRFRVAAAQAPDQARAGSGADERRSRSVAPVLFG